MLGDTKRRVLYKFEFVTPILSLKFVTPILLTYCKGRADFPKQSKYYRVLVTASYQYNLRSNWGTLHHNPTKHKKPTDDNYLGPYCSCRWDSSGLKART